MFDMTSQCLVLWSELNKELLSHIFSPFLPPTNCELEEDVKKKAKLDTYKQKRVLGHFEANWLLLFADGVECIPVRLDWFQHVLQSSQARPVRNHGNMEEGVGIIRQTEIGYTHTHAHTHAHTQLPGSPSHSSLHAHPHTIHFQRELIHNMA